MKINSVIRTLVIADFFTNAGFSVFAPVFAVFITGQIQNGSMEVVGFGAALFQIFKSGLQIPIARFLDKDPGEYDDFLSLVFGSILLSTIPFWYLFATKAHHIYIIQSIYGIGAAFAIPPWYAMFSRHVDKMKENVEWSMDSISVGAGAAIAAALGGIIATRFGFQAVFIIAGFLAIFGAIQQLLIFRDAKAHTKMVDVKPVPDKL